MSNAQNLGYAVVQVVHNLGAVAAVGGSVAGAARAGAAARRGLAWVSLGGWGAQAASGAAFGGVSYLYYHQFPDIAGVAVAALAVKVVCVATGFLILAALLLRGSGWKEESRDRAWHACAALSVVALCAAAFLRWFS